MGEVILIFRFPEVLVRGITMYAVILTRAMIFLVIVLLG